MRLPREAQAPFRLASAAEKVGAGKATPLSWTCNGPCHDAITPGLSLAGSNGAIGSP